jgi:hypothetical protein
VEQDDFARCAQPGWTVAPIFNRLYRGFLTRCPHDFPRAADCKSAIQQVANLRYATVSTSFGGTVKLRHCPIVQCKPPEKIDIAIARF